MLKDKNKGKDKQKSGFEKTCQLRPPKQQLGECYFVMLSRIPLGRLAKACVPTLELELYQTREMYLQNHSRGISSKAHMFDVCEAHEASKAKAPDQGRQRAD